MQPNIDSANNSSSEFSNNEELIQAYSLTDERFKTKRKSYLLKVLENFFLFHGKDFDVLTDDDCQGYLDYLRRVHQHRGVSEQTSKLKVQLVLRFLEFLQKNKVGKLSNKTLPEKQKPVARHSDTRRKKSVNRKTYTKKAVELPSIIEHFLLYLNNMGYRQPETKKRIMLFQSYLKTEGVNIECFFQEENEKYLFTMVQRYEEMLANRITLEEIKTSTATSYLRSIQLFIRFLHSRGIVSMKYTIPVHLRGSATRSNDYVPQEGIISLMNAIYENSYHVERDLAILLITVDTGCRPIEITNLSLKDIDTLQRTISLVCGKTDKRTVKISAEVMGVIKDYLSVRNQYVPKTEQLFSNCSGNPITSDDIYSIFYQANQRAFGKRKYSPKALRHTYITNALQEHGFERVSKAIGHKDSKSTYYYYHRSSKRLLSNTLESSPLKSNGGTRNAD